MSNPKKTSVWGGDTVNKLFGNQPMSQPSTPRRTTSTVSRNVQSRSKPLLPTIKPRRRKTQPSPVLGFSSRKEFRDLTRPLARKHRGSTVIISGSSVTGKSYKTGQKFGPSSDIDIGLVDRRLRNSRQVNYRGFPVPKTQLGREERSLQRSFRSSKSRKTGIKVFSNMPNRPVYIRPHTPPRQRKKYL
jgi:hypothetical protein